MNPAAAILLSGNMCDARLWSGRGELLRTVLGERSVVWTDADLTRDDSIAAMAARALAATDGPVLAIGFSMGAIVAVEMAVQAPDRVAGLVLAGYNATADLPERAAIRPLQQAEVRAGGLDVLVLHAEHAPFDRAALDLCILAARTGGKPVLVRPASGSHEHILNALDCGADGVIVPHIRSVVEAERLVSACHYVGGGCGYAGSSRAAGYTTKGMARHRADAVGVTIIAQIEDVEGVEAIEAIAQVQGIHALFIGRADLTIAYGAETPDDPQVIAAVSRICAAGNSAGRAVGMFLGRVGDVPGWREQGASLFILGSDHDFLLGGAAALGKAIRD